MESRSTTKNKDKEEETKTNQGGAAVIQEKGGPDLAHQQQLLLNALLAQISQGNFLGGCDGIMRTGTSAGDIKASVDTRARDGGKTNSQVGVQMK